MKKTIMNVILVGSLGLSSLAFAENATVYYPDNSPVVSNQVTQGKTRAQVNDELKQARQSGEMKHLNKTIYFGN